MSRQLTITPDNPDPIPTERYIRLLTVLASFILIGLIGFFALRLLALIHHTVLLFALAGLLAYALDPIVELVRGAPPVEAAVADPNPDAPPKKVRKQHPRWLGVLTVFLVLIVAAGIGIFALGREAIHQGELLSRDREHIARRATEEMDHADGWLHSHGVPVSLGETLHHPPEGLKQWGEAAARGSVGIATAAGRDLAEGTIILLITAFFLLYSEEMRHLTTRATAPRLRPYLSAWQDDVNRILGGFVRGQAILALVMGSSAAVVCLLLGLRFWLLIGVFVVVASLIPVAGPFIGAIPAIASALLTPAGMLSPVVRAILVIVLFVAINEFGSKVLYPKLVGKALGLHEVLVLFVLLSGLEIGGITGVLFAAPLTALASVTVLQLWRIWLALPPKSFRSVEDEVAQTASMTTGKGRDSEQENDNSQDSSHSADHPHQNSV